MDANRVSSLLSLLPAVFQDDRPGDKPNFLGRFLLGFEKLMLGLGDDHASGTEGVPDLQALRGLEESIAQIHRYFEPGAALADDDRAPSEFLPWLAGFLALTLRDDWDDQRRRDLIAQASRLYRLRGTKRGLQEIAKLYTLHDLTIDEISIGFQIGVHSTIDKDTILDGGAPFFFRVRVPIATPDPKALKEITELAQAIIELQKPAHTYFRLELETPTFQIDVHSTVGVDTLLGDPPAG